MQQWELLASPGHVLLTRVDEYRRKLRLPTLLLGGAVLAALAAAPVASAIASAAAGSVEWVMRKGGGLVASPPAQSAAPSLKQVQPVVPSGFAVSLDLVPDFEGDVLPAMKAQVLAAGQGKRLDHCDFSRKIDADWAAADDVSPRCRYSQDGERLWVWSIVKNKGQLRPWVGLIKRDGKSAKLFHIAVAGSPVAGSDPAALPLSHIPRTVAQDFPELIEKPKTIKELEELLK